MSQNLNTNNVLVTGAAGYIGGITSIELFRKGYNVYGVDRRSSLHLSSFFKENLTCDFTDYDTLLLLKRIKPIAIVHCAGTSLVGPSMQHPGVYFDNNVSRTNKLLSFIKDELPNTRFIFSSSASVYGNYSNDPYKEYMDKLPVSPYGESKLMIENILKWYGQCHNLQFVSLRYFNACGADQYARHGQEPNSSHIFAKLFEAVNNNEPFVMNGSDYDTKDGTCIRDYIHVADIATANIISIEGGFTGFYNLGTHKGHSNLECLQQVEKIYDRKIKVNYNSRREGDPPFLVADPTKFEVVTNWKAWRTLPMIVSHLKEWYSSKIFKSLINKKRPKTLIPL
jgi:UDP-glucose 4-epimerase